MSSKAQANSNDKSPLRHQVVQPEAQRGELQDQSMVPARVVQKARTAPRLLTSHDVLQLQRTTGNQAVIRRLASTQSPHQLSAEVQRETLPEVEYSQAQFTFQREEVTEGRGASPNDDVSLAREADAMGKQAVQSKANKPQVNTLSSIQANGDVGRADVVEIEDYVPNCVDNGDLSRKTYRRNEGEIRGLNDTDLFYADGDGPLVPITVDMVNAYFDPRYVGFHQTSGPDWRRNCEDYAKEYAGFGQKIGDYSSADELIPLVQKQGGYVLQLAFHWMSVDNTNGSSITIRQKDGESAVYQRTYDSLQDAANYILSKRGLGGSVFATQ